MRSSAYIVAACVAGLFALLVESRSALAQREYRVTISSQPSGMQVWIDGRDGDAVGTTPHNTSLTEGKHTIFLEGEGFEIAVHEITVKARNRGKQRFSFDMVELRYGTIDILAADGADDSEGAKVLVDGEDKGTVPDSFEAPEGPHQVEVVKDGFKRFEAWIEVKKGESIEVTVALEADSKSGKGDKGDDGDGGDGGKGGKGKDGDGGGKRDRPGPGSTLVRFGAGMGAGWRRFDYDNPATNNLRPYEANGIPLVNLNAELYLGGLASSLSRFSVFAGASLSLPMQSNTAVGNEGIDTTWFRREAGLRARFAAGPGQLGVDLAEGGNAFTFANAGLLADEIPGAEYEYARVGAWYGTASPDMSIGGGADAMVVFSTKGVSERFANSSVLGGRAHAWFRRRLVAGLEGTLQSSLTYFKYSLEPGPLHAADGGHDLMIDVVATAGYSF